MEKRSEKVAENKSAQKTKEVSNEEPEKKIIKLCKLTTNNLDPLAFFSRFLDIPEMILQHFCGQDLIKISEVSPFCYNFIAASKDHMKKIKIVFNGELLQKDCDSLKNSSRLYQNIEVRRNFVQQIPRNDFNEFNYISTSELDFFLSKARDWKSILINETYFKRKLDLVKFLSAIEPSIESFSVINTKSIAFPFDEDSSLDFESFEALAFPKLKHFKMQFYNHAHGGVSDVYSNFFVNSVALEKFEYEAVYSIIKGSALMKMLENSDKLTSLSLKTFISQMFGCDSWKRFNFKLKNLVFHSEQTFNDINFRDFLKSQCDLESLSLDVPHCEEIFPDILKLTKLRTLALKDFKVNSNDVPNELFKTITHLKVRYLVSPFSLKNRLNISCSYFVDPVSLKFMLMSMPNVKSLHFYEINKEIFQVLLEIKTKFVELKVVCLNGVEEEDLKILLINENDKCLVDSFD